MRIFSFSNSFSTWEASVGLVRPKRLALGAASGASTDLSNDKATGWRGQRMPTVSRPEVIKEFTSLAFGNTRVSGPGQKCFARNSAIGLQSVVRDFAWTGDST